MRCVSGRILEIVLLDKFTYFNLRNDEIGDTSVSLWPHRVNLSKSIHYWKEKLKTNQLVQC